jgi:predicted patatin/cPLA2 family phospholipase
MKAIVISGGGSKGAFAGGVAQYLIEEKDKKYDMFLGTSTGSLIAPLLALDDVPKLKKIYTSVNQRSIFSNNPFVVRKKKGETFISINYLNVFLQQLKGKRTFGETKKLRKLIRLKFSEEEFTRLKASGKEVVVTVTNLTKNTVEYKSIQDYGYEDFCDWVWISCNYVPFMSLVTKNGDEYADGGFGCIVPIHEAIKRGATEIDAIILETEHGVSNKKLGRNPFSLMVNLFSFLIDQVERHDINIGKLSAKFRDVKLNLYFTPTKLTDNSLVFNKKQMAEWWEQGYHHAKMKNQKMDE